MLVGLGARRARRARRSVDDHLVGVAEERRRGVQVRQARPEDRGPAERGHGERRAQERGGDRRGGGAAPRSSALRAPTTIVGGAPAAATNPTTATSRGAGQRPVHPRGADRRPESNARTTATVASARPQQDRDVETEAGRGLGEACFADRGERGERVGEASAPAAPARPTSKVDAMPSATRLRRPKPRATRTGNSSLSTRRVRLRACPTTAAPASAARRPAATSRPPAGGWSRPPAPRGCSRS